jgi:hypothetical protein
MQRRQKVVGGREFEVQRLKRATSAPQTAHALGYPRLAKPSRVSSSWSEASRRTNERNSWLVLQRHPFFLQEEDRSLEETLRRKEESKLKIERY